MWFKEHIKNVSVLQMSNLSVYHIIFGVSLRQSGSIRCNPCPFPFLSNHSSQAASSKSLILFLSFDFSFVMPWCVEQVQHFFSRGENSKEGLLISKFSKAVVDFHSWLFYSLIYLSLLTTSSQGSVIWLYLQLKQHESGRARCICRPSLWCLRM